MNKIEKRFNKAQRKESNRLRKWWRNNNYKVWRVLLFWIWIPCLCLQKIKDKRYKSLRYSDMTTKKYLDKLMPSLVVEYEDSPDVILFYKSTDNYGGIKLPWDLWSNFVKKKSRRAYNYFRRFDDDVKNYIFNAYEIDGYSKININNWADWDKAVEKFNWYYAPYDKNYAKGVVFYKDNAVTN